MRRTILHIILISGWLLGITSTSAQLSSYQLPDAVKKELKRIEETYRILEQFSEQVWPGWKDYRDFPFKIEFDNGLVVLTGHPKPPEGFERIDNYKVAGRDVYADRRNLSSLPLNYPFTGGGGLIPYGYDTTGKMINIVNLRLNSFPADSIVKRSDAITEKQILIYIHELFHGFQKSIMEYRAGNLQYNPDVNYAIYSCIEGRALANAYREKDDAKAVGFLKDFVEARKLKVSKSMTDLESRQESDDDLMEGTANYSEIRILELLSKGYSPGILSEEDPACNGFRETSGLLKSLFTDQLDQNAIWMSEAKFKCYSYGCAQALMLQRLFNGWQDSVTLKKKYLSETIRGFLPMTKEECETSEARFRTLYGIDTIAERAKREIGERDQAVLSIVNRKGQSYILNFKPIHYYVTSVKNENKFRLGLTEAYPEGFGKLTISDIEVTGLDTIPVEKNQLFYLKIVDTSPPKGEKPYSIRCDKMEGDSVYFNAVITSPLFTIKAPKVAIKESKGRVKFTFLSRVKE
ncbi:MAG: hypothetical protein WCO93_09385 [bacterium]